MPSLWSARFLLSANAAPSPSHSAALNGHSPRLAGRDGERSPAVLPPPGPSSPSRAGADAGQMPAHTRSTSNPLPKIFGRKKSAVNLEQHGMDMPLDDDLVPVMEPPATLTHATSGKKHGKASAAAEDRSMRNCMCCDSKVKVPRDLNKFRCMGCHTINDLRPMEEQSSDLDGNPRPPVDSQGRSMASRTRAPPLSLDRTRSLIDRCVVAYLQGRCRRTDEVGGKTPETPVATPEEKENPMADRSQSKDLPILSSDGRPSPLTRGSNTQTPTRAPLLTSRSTPAHGPGPPGSITRKALPAQPNRRPPPPPVDSALKPPTQRLHPNSQGAPNSEASPHHPSNPRLTAQEVEARRRYERIKTIFRPLEDYIAASFGDVRSLNAAFTLARPMHATERARSENNICTPPPELESGLQPGTIGLSQVDGKTLLLGDIGENGTWWTGRLGRNRSDKSSMPKKVGEGSTRITSSRSPNINWSDVRRWYDLIHTAGENWPARISDARLDGPGFAPESIEGLTNVEAIEEDLSAAREHAVRALLKVTENVLKRPGRLIHEPDTLRFLLIILENPSLYPSQSAPRRVPSTRAQASSSAIRFDPPPVHESPKTTRSGSQHPGILKRVFGLLANSSDACQRHLVAWFARLDDVHLTAVVDLVASFVTTRIARRSSRPRSTSTMADGGLIPDLSGSAMNTSAQLHAAMGLSGSTKKRPDEAEEPYYTTDWQTRVAAKLMSLLFHANNIWQGKRRGDDVSSPRHMSTKRSGQLLHTSTFYCTLLDYQDIIADFKTWEAKCERFAFCQYPLFLSMGNKIKILEYDARRQMEIKAREAYFDSVIRQRALDGHFHLRVRRDCLVDDSLRQISEAVGSGQEELKKGLRVHFTGEEGVDAGGPRKEWFLMLVRDIFDPNHGMFEYDAESGACYFNPHSFETSDQYHLVGALLGLAIYNSTILDVALPPFAFRKLLAAAPGASPAASKAPMTYTLADLAEFRPSLAAGLQQLLDFDGDVQETYAWDFVVPTERYGAVVSVPLVPHGASVPVTNANRHAFVAAYVRHLLDAAVARQFEPFRRGFFHVCAGNALSLFRPEEIERLVRGSDEPLDVDALRAVAVYDHWRDPLRPGHPPVAAPDAVPVVRWFWEVFAAAPPARQRALLSFITGTDRIPAVGAASLVLRIVAGGGGWGGGGVEERMRFPTARTCFNVLVLWWYESCEQLEERLWRAVEESEGFGLK